MYKIARKIALLLVYMVTNSWKISFKVLSVGLRETEEFLDYSLVAPLFFFKSTF